MNNIRKVISGIFGYFQRTRDTGHTDLIKRGAANTPNSLIVGNTMPYAHQVCRSLDKVRPACLEDFEEGKLKGLEMPIAFDNSALMKICYAVLEELDLMEAIIAIKTEENDDLIAENRRLKAKIRELQQIATLS